MTDSVSTAVRSQIMRRVKSKNTGPEVFVRRRLHEAGYRYKLNVTNMPGKPDIVLPRYRSVVFVHGCFWHFHGCKRSQIPSSNTTYWTKKIYRNFERDKQHIKKLEQDGWHVTIIWECEIEKSTKSLIHKLNKIKLSLKSNISE